MKKRSLIEALTIIQIMIFVGMCLFIVFESVILYQKSMKSLLAERSSMIINECHTIENRMDVVSQQTFEIFRSTIKNQENIWLPSRNENLFDIQDLSENIREKLLLYPDLDYVFAYRPDSFIVSRMQSNGEGLAKIALGEYLKQTVQDTKDTLARGKWELCSVEQQSYCEILYYYQEENFYVTTFIRAEKLFSGIREQFREYIGNGQITDQEGQAYLIRENEVPKQKSDMIFPRQEIHGEFVLTGYFHVKMLELFRNNVLLMVAGVFAMGLVILCLQRWMISRYILKSICQLSDTVKKADTDLSAIRIPCTSKIEEIAVLEHSLDELVHEVLAVRVELYEKKIQEQNFQLQGLRAQLKPHFYLNAIMTASTMVYQNRNEETREYLQQLSTYMRYMMRIRESRVKLGEELEHVENYVKMQEIRFPGSILLVAECPEKLNEIRVPHLLLHTIVENVFKYAMSLTETLMLMISCREIEENGFRGVQIIVEDNGKGFTSEQLEKYNGDTVSNEEKDTQIGLSNIKRSLKLWYGQENLFHISNAIPNGAQVEIRIPEEGEKMDESIDC